MIVIKKEDYILVGKTARFLNGYRLNLFLISLFEVIGIVMDVVQPLIWGYLIADVCRMRFNNIIHYILALAVLMTIQIIGDYLEAYYKAKTNEGVEKDIRNEIYSNVLQFKMRTFDKMGAGDILDHLEGDVDAASRVFTETFLGLVINIIKAITISVIVIKINYVVAIVVLLFFPITLLSMKAFGKRIRKTDEMLRNNTDKYYSFVQDAITCMREIKSLGIKQRNLDAFNQVIEKNKTMQIKMCRIEAALNSAVQGISFGLQLLLFIIGIQFIVIGELKVELFVALISYSEMMSYSLMQVAQINPELQESFVSMKRLFNILESTEYDKERFGTKEIEKVVDSIRFKNVSFSYTDVPVLNNVSFELKRECKNILCGNSGSGKTTITELILKLYDIESGRIEINGISISDISEKSLREKITVVSQEPHLFNGDLRFNIALNNDAITDDEIEAICKYVCVDDLIDSLPKGINTILTNLGADFSVGQKQRIAIARAIASSSDVIIFDESTTGLDGHRKKKLVNFINAYSKKHMVIMVDHRMAGIRKSDNVIYIGNGRVKGEGTHGDMLATNSEYRKLYDIERQ